MSKFLKLKIKSILKDEFSNRFAPDTLPSQLLDSHTGKISDEIMEVAERFWGVEDAIDATSKVDFSTDKLVGRCSTLIKGCRELRKLTSEQFPTISKELETISDSLNGVKKDLIKRNRRRPPHQSLRRPHAEELALQIIYTLKQYDIDIKGIHRFGTPGTALAILIEVFDVIFQGYFSGPGSITNLITDLRKREKEKFHAFMQDSGIDYTDEDLSAVLQDLGIVPIDENSPTVLQDIKNYPF